MFYTNTNEVGDNMYTMKVPIVEIENAEELKEFISENGAIVNTIEYYDFDEFYEETNDDNIYSGSDADAAFAAFERVMAEGREWYKYGGEASDFGKNPDYEEPERIKYIMTAENGKQAIYDEPF